MRSDRVRLTCPNCHEPIDERDVPDPPRWYGPRRREETDTPRACGRCGWQFLTLGAAVEDDGGLDADGLFATDADGEWATEPDAEVRCPRCARRLDVAEPGPLRCGFCRRTSEFLESPCRGLVDASGPVPDWRSPDPGEWDYDPYDDDAVYDYFDPCCPSGCAEEYGGAAPVDPLADGYVLCQQCGELFHHPELFRATRDEWAVWHDEPRNRPAVLVDPARKGRTFPEACRRVRPGGVIRLRPGDHPAPDPLQAHDVTLEGRGPAGAVRAGGLQAVWGAVRAVGVTFTGPVVLQHVRGWFVRCRFERGLTVSGWRSAVRVRRCGGEGVTASDAAKVELFRSRFTSVVAADGGWVSAGRCRFRSVVGDPRTGVFLTRCRAEAVAVNGRGVLTRCRVSAVDAGEQARVVLRRCEVGLVRKAATARVAVSRRDRADDPVLV